jgi:hypothetical protein
LDISLLTTAPIKVKVPTLQASEEDLYQLSWQRLPDIHWRLHMQRIFFNISPIWNFWIMRAQFKALFKAYTSQHPMARELSFWRVVESILLQYACSFSPSSIQDVHIWLGVKVYSTMP